MAIAEIIPHARLKLFDPKDGALHLLVTILLVSLLLIACGSTNRGSNTSSGNNGKGCKKIGLLLPDTGPLTRWERKDLPLLIQHLKTLVSVVTVDYNNAAASASEQQSQADADLARGDCILVVAAVDSVKAAAFVSRARLRGVPVIAYDRLIQSRDLAYYVSFDNVKVGELQGQYIVDHYKDYVKGNNHNLVMINGAQTDNNAILFRQGALHKLQPLFDSGALTKVLDVYTPNWDNAAAQAEMTAALTAYQNNIQIAYVASDRLASDVIAALKAVKLNGKVLVTSQGASVTGIQNILTGDQAMMVYNYKASDKEALATAELVAAISKGTNTASLTNGATIQTADGGSIPAVIVASNLVAVDKSNIASTVIADGAVSKFAVCSGLPAGTNTNGLYP